MKIAITGGAGRIGKRSTEIALAQGHEVVSIDRVAPGPDLIKLAYEASGRLSFCYAEITDYNAVYNAFKGCNAVIHLAALLSPDAAPQPQVHHLNVTGSYNALCAAALLGIKKVCQASSVNATGLVFSRAPKFDYFPLDEKHPTYNEDPYSLSKWICEQQADSFARRYEDMTIASMRFHWVLPSREVALNGFAGMGGYKQYIDIGIRQLWAWTHLDAAARACVQSLSANYVGHEAFYIVAPNHAWLGDSRDLAHSHYPAVPIRGEFSGQCSFFDSSKAERLLGWRHVEVE
ncbi:MAG: NAD(P)-dependent oxidoreductase [Anaerolineae bacterium]|nr:NAD(P)-dependent oxidoreductase [Anaerolineae bacterium]